MNNSVKVKTANGNYTIISNEVFNHGGLSFGAIGLLCFLLAKSDIGYELSDDSSEVKELIAAGFITVNGDQVVVSDRVMGG